MRSMKIAISAGLLAVACGSHVLANVTIQSSSVGGGQAFSNLQESLAITYFTPSSGTYPSRDGCCSGSSLPMGFLRMSGTNFVPGYDFETNGAQVSIPQNAALFSLFGTQFGGDGRTSFGIPNLQGVAPRHVGGSSSLGFTQGESQTTIGVAQMPAHQHAFNAGNSTTETTGAGAPFTNLQPSQGLNYVINIGGAFPSRSSGGNPSPFLGQVALFGGNFAPSGWAFANGQSIDLANDNGLFSVLGTTFGGDGRTNFLLPDLRDRLVVGTSQVRDDLGQVSGQTIITLQEQNLPPHDHVLPNPFGSTELVGEGEPVSNVEPSIALNYLIATSGLFPSRDGLPEEKFLGEITLFAGDFAPDGWAFANGDLLDISSNAALFSLLGTNFGGDGRTNFRLPDLRGRVAIGTGQGEDGLFYRIGGVYGMEEIAITEGILPSHFHNATVVPLPAALPLMIVALGLLGRSGRQR